MKNKIRVFSSQFNYRYGSKIHFPYSIASVIAYSRSFEHLDKAYTFEKTFIFRDKLSEYINRCVDVNILLCSCYVWNWEITNILAKKVKEKNPSCLIIFGGPQVPLRYEGMIVRKGQSGNFFEDYPYVDILVHGEGEYILKEILDAYLKGNDLSKIKGIETKNYRNPLAERIQDLNTLPSPYLTNLIWDLVEDFDGIDYAAAWETNRGCPFQCVFCNWGSYINRKIQKWSMDRLIKEIEWFGDNKITYIDCCDANFGIFVDRDLEIAKLLKKMKLRTGYPEKVRPAWSKTSSEKIIPIAKELLEADLLRAVTLAVQSLDKETLDIIKRRNIPFNSFPGLVKKFRDAGIENYTEIIIGLPGETLDSFKRGLEQLMELFPRPTVFVYNCGVFVNAPMNDSDYVKKYNIKTVRSPVLLGHSSIHNRGDILEYEDIVISTSSFTLEDLKQMFLYSWIMQSFHSLGILEYISKFYNQIYGLKYIDFYTSFIDYCKSRDSMFSKEYKIILEHIDIGYSGKGWDHYDLELADINWLIEEATWLRCVRVSEILEAEINKFLSFLEKQKKFDTKAEILTDLIGFQVFLLSTMDKKEPTKSYFSKYDWKDFFINEKRNIAEINNFSQKYSCKNKVTEKQTDQWCFKAIWLGRSMCNYKTHPVDLSI